MRSVGFEVLDAFSMSSGDPSLQGREDGYHIGHALTDTLIDLTLNQASAPHASPEPCLSAPLLQPSRGLNIGSALFGLAG